MVYSNSETECRDRHGVEIAVPQPQPLERGRHVPSPQGECQEGDPPAQQRRRGYENEAAHAGDQEQAREASQRDRAEELGQWISRQRSEEHTSELQSPDHLVCRLLLEKKNNETDGISACLC